MGEVVQGTRGSEESETVLPSSDELEALRREFDELIYIISHDFQAPLRGINTVSEWLKSDYGEKLGDSGLELVALMQSRVDRLSTMVERLLRYSRVGRYESLTVPVAEADLFRELQRQFDGRCKLRVVSADEGVRQVMDYENLLSVFTEILENAITFHDGAGCEVEIHAAFAGQSQVEYRVSDNGPGFSGEGLEQAFNLFYTSFSIDQTDNCGMGLPICKKTVVARGGEITVDVDVKTGGCVHFTWPISMGI